MPALWATTVGRYNYKKEATFTAIFCCVVSSFGGLLFGYDRGVAGGVSAMPQFLETFFPGTYETKYGNNTHMPASGYCTFNSQTLQLFNSSMYLAALVASLVSAYVAKIKGRKPCMVIDGLMGLLGAGLTAGAVAKPAGLYMLIIGRCCIGSGIGFGNSSVNIYSSEIAPNKYRGMLNLLFQWSTTIGTIVAQLVNYGTEPNYKYGWRISLAVAAAPACMILLGGIFLPETPTSLIARNFHEDGRKVLRLIRGEEDIEREFEDIVSNTRVDTDTSDPLKEMLKPCYRPYVVVSVLISCFQQLTGSNAILFYAPQLFSSFGTGKRTALLQTVIIGAVMCGGTLVAILLVDRVGRKALFLTGGCIMFACQVTIGVCLKHLFNEDAGEISKSLSRAMLAVICIYIANYSWSWAPLGWLVPSEIQPAEIRSAGMSLATSTNMLFTFLIGQCFLTMLCHMKFWVFIFFAGWLVIMNLFICFFLPETKGLPLEQVFEAFTEHWFWKRYPDPPRSYLSQTSRTKIDPNHL